MYSSKARLIGCLIGGAAVTIYGLAVLFQARQTADWPSVEGTVLRAQVAEHWTLRGRVYQPDVRYRYQVGERVFEGSRLWSEGFSRPSRATIERLVSPLSPGTAVKVFYQSSAPANAVLYQGTQANMFLPLGIGVACFLWAGWIGFRRSQRKRTTRPGRP